MVKRQREAAVAKCAGQARVDLKFNSSSTARIVLFLFQTCMLVDDRHVDKLSHEIAWVPEFPLKIQFGTGM